MSKEKLTNKKPKICKDCKNPNCPKCGTTHGMWECIKGKDGQITQEVAK